MMCRKLQVSKWSQGVPRGKDSTCEDTGEVLNTPHTAAHSLVGRGLKCWELDEVSLEFIQLTLLKLLFLTIEVPGPESRLSC